MGKKNTKKAAKNAGTKAAKNATAKVSKNVGKEPRWKRCSICSKIPPSSGEFYKGGDLESGGFVPEVAKLKVVGEPYYNDDTSHTHSCFKYCPECGTVYHWSMEYEYLVNGSEDDIDLVRLDEAEGEQAIDLPSELALRGRASHRLAESKPCDFHRIRSRPPSRGR